MLEEKMQHFAAAILAGGTAKRLGGIAKGTLSISSGVSIVACLINELGQTGINDIVIVANNAESYKDYGVEVISDLRSGIGPLGGIEAGLVHFAERADAVMFVPCDMPNLTAKEMSALIEAFSSMEKPVVFAQTPGFFWHTLCAVVHIAMRQPISSSIDQGKRTIRDIWRQVDAAAVKFSDERAFFNINSAADIDRWREAGMTKRIYADGSVAEKMKRFMDAEKIAAELVTGEPAEVRVLACDEQNRLQSNLDTIYSGGWISCQTARGLADKLEVPLKQMGKLLNHLDVKIRNCGLGCFK